MRSISHTGQAPTAMTNSFTAPTELSSISKRSSDQISTAASEERMSQSATPKRRKTDKKPELAENPFTKSASDKPTAANREPKDQLSKAISSESAKSDQNLVAANLKSSKPNLVERSPHARDSPCRHAFMRASHAPSSGLESEQTESAAQALKTTTQGSSVSKSQPSGRKLVPKVRMTPVVTTELAPQSIPSSQRRKLTRLPYDPVRDYGIARTGSHDPQYPQQPPVQLP